MRNPPHEVDGTHPCWCSPAVFVHDGPGIITVHDEAGWLEHAYEDEYGNPPA